MVGFLYLVSLPDATPPTEPTPEDVVDDEPTPTVEFDEVSTEVPEEAADAAGPVAVVGRVVDGDFRPLGGTRLIVGEEATTTNDQGVFRFQSEVRPRSASLTCERAGGPTASWEVVVGSAQGDEEAALTFESAPARLDWIRWTLNLFGEAAPAEGLWVRAHSVLVEEWGNGGRVQVLGSTNLPDGAHISGSVYFDEMRSFSSFDSGEVKGGEFRVTLWGVAGHRLFSGTYTLKLTFNEVFELPSVVETWKQLRPQITTWSLTTEQQLFIGDAEQAAAEDRAAQAYYIDTRAAVGVLKAMLVTRVREARTLGRRWDPQLLKDRVDAREGWFHAETVTQDGRLAEEEWRAFLDRRWRPELRERLENHQARGAQKYQEAEGRVQSLLSDLLRESYAYSRFVVYPLFNLPGHPNDFYQDESEAGDLTLLELRFRKNLSGLERFCRLVEDAEIRRFREGEAPDSGE